MTDLLQTGSHRLDSADEILELRVDNGTLQDGRRRVSGDLYEVRSGANYYAGTLFALRIDEDASGSLALRFQLTGIGSAQTFTGRMHRVDGKIALDLVRGSSTTRFKLARSAPGVLRLFEYRVYRERADLWPPPRVKLPADGGGVQQVAWPEPFTDIGVRIEPAQDQPVVSLGLAAGHRWTRAELVELLRKVTKLRGLTHGQIPLEPFFTLFMLGRSDRTNRLGVMFDERRRAAAVFRDAVESDSDSPGDMPRNLLHTMMHEVGHLLNLPHAFEGASLADLRRNDLSVMNYPDKFRSLPYPIARQTYWGEFKRFSFAHSELNFLQHAERRKLLMGGADYQGEGFDALAMRNGGFGGSIDRGIRLDIRVRSFGRKTDVPCDSDEAGPIPIPFGSPLRIESRLVNDGRRSREVADNLEPDEEYVHYFIKRPSGEVTTYRPYLASITAQRRRQLKGKRKIYRDILISHDRTGYLLTEPGLYEITAVSDVGETPLVSNALRVWVQYPLPHMERRIVRTFQEGIFRYFAVGGSVLNSAEQGVLEDLRPRGSEEPHPLWDEYQVLQARLSERGLRTYDPSRRKAVWEIPQRPDLKLFRQALGFENNILERRIHTSQIMFGDLTTRLSRLLLQDGDTDGSASLRNESARELTRLGTPRPVVARYRAGDSLTREELLDDE